MLWLYTVEIVESTVIFMIWLLQSHPYNFCRVLITLRIRLQEMLYTILESVNVIKLIAKLFLWEY